MDVETFLNNYRRWLWVPAFAGTTTYYLPVCFRHAAKSFSVCSSVAG
jgi:hypothetical protein